MGQSAEQRPDDDAQHLDLRLSKAYAVFAAIGIAGFEVITALQRPWLPPPSAVLYGLLVAMVAFAALAHWHEPLARRYERWFRLIPWGLMFDSLWRLARAEGHPDLALPVLAVLFGCSMIPGNRRELRLFLLTMLATLAVILLRVESSGVPRDVYFVTVSLIAALSYFLKAHRFEDTESLQRGERMLEQTQKIAGIGGWEYRPRSQQVRWTGGMHRLLAAPADLQPEPETILDLVDSASAEALEVQIAQALETGARVEMEREVRLHDGSRRWLRVITDVTAGRDGRVILGTIQDVTVYKDTQRALIEARDVAEKALAARSQFLANMSHEIRTPMNGVIGMSSLLEELDLDPQQRDYVSMIRGSSESLLVIINDILDFSKIDAGRIELEAAPFSLDGCLAEALNTVAASAAAKGLELVLDVAPDCPDVLVGDATRLRQVLVNLLSNAVKFTDAGEILVRVDVEGRRAQPEGPLQLTLSVHDTGIGIRAADRDRLFRAFEQEDASTTRLHGGTGLGLAISRHLVELMGGRIEVDSTPGAGSCFTVRLRLAAGTQPAATERRPLRAHIVLLEGNDRARAATVRMLEGFGLACTAFATAPALLAQAPPTDPAFLVAALDPEDAAASATAEALRCHVGGGAPAPTLWLVPLGSGAAADGGDRSLRLAKPLRPLALRAALSALGRLEARGAGAASAAVGQMPPPAPVRAPEPAEVASAPPGLRILLAEDNPVNQLVARRLLERLGTRVEIAGTGRAALEAALAQPYDLILMDVQMPEMDGLEATRRLRAAQASTAQRTPVVAMTANVMQETRDACREAGMDDFLPKPVDAAALEALITRFGVAATPALRAAP